MSRQVSAKRRVTIISDEEEGEEKVEELPKRKKRKRDVKVPKEGKVEKVSRKKSNKRQSPSSERDSLYDLDSSFDQTAPLLPLKEFVSDRPKLLQEAMIALKGKRLNAMMPHHLKSYSKSDFEDCCLDVLDRFSNETIIAVLEGRSESSTESPKVLETKEKGKDLSVNKLKSLLKIDSHLKATSSSTSKVKKKEKRAPAKLESDSSSSSSESDAPKKSKKEKKKKKAKVSKSKKKDKKKKKKKKKVTVLKEDSDAATLLPGGQRTIMELLELEFRAKAIKALLKSQGVQGNIDQLINGDEKNKSVAKEKTIVVEEETLKVDQAEEDKKAKEGEKAHEMAKEEDRDDFTEEEGDVTEEDENDAATVEEEKVDVTEEEEKSEVSEEEKDEVSEEEAKEDEIADVTKKLEDQFISPLSNECANEEYDDDDILDLGFNDSTNLGGSVYESLLPPPQMSQNGKTTKEEMEKVPKSPTHEDIMSDEDEMDDDKGCEAQKAVKVNEEPREIEENEPESESHPQSENDAQDDDRPETWYERWYLSKKVQNVVKSTKMMAKVRKGQKDGKNKALEEKPVKVDIIGSISEYQSLFGESESQNEKVEPEKEEKTEPDQVIPPPAPQEEDDEDENDELWGNILGN